MSHEGRANAKLPDASASTRDGACAAGTLQDPDAFDDDDCSIYSDPPESVVDMIEEERCLKSPDGTHIYIRQNTCNYCDTQAPWIRRDQCRVA